MPRIYPLEGEVGLALYDGEVKVNLGRLAEVIQDWPDTNNPHKEQ